MVSAKQSELTINITKIAISNLIVAFSLPKLLLYFGAGEKIKPPTKRV